MTDLIRTGVKKSSRERKNGASREAWLKRKAAANATRGQQVFVISASETGPDAGHYERVHTVPRYYENAL